MAYLSRLVTSYICYLCQYQEKFNTSLTYIYIIRFSIFYVKVKMNLTYTYMSRFYFFYIKVIRLLDFMSKITKSFVIITS